MLSLLDSNVLKHHMMDLISAAKAHHGHLFLGSAASLGEPAWRHIMLVDDQGRSQVFDASLARYLPESLQHEICFGDAENGIQAGASRTSLYGFSQDQLHYLCLPITAEQQIWAVVWLFGSRPLALEQNAALPAIAKHLGKVFCGMPSIGGGSAMPGRAASHDFQPVIDAMFNAVLLVDDNGLIQRHNIAAERMLSTNEPLIGCDVQRFVPNYYELVSLPSQPLMAAEAPEGQLFENTNVITASDRRMIVDMSTFTLGLDNDILYGVVLDDISDRLDAAQDYQNTLQRFQVLTNLAPAGILQLNHDWACSYANRTWCEYSEMTIDDALGRGWIHAIDERDVNTVLAVMRQQLATAGEFEGEFRLRSPLGTIRWVKANACCLYNDSGVITGIIVAVSDITSERNTQMRLRDIAEHDQLTGLINRTFFNDRLEAALKGVGRYGSVALLFLDLDDFKMINDSFGHDAGDDLLRQIAARLHDVVRNADTLARLGGDEFTIILTNINEPRTVATVADKIVAALSAPVILNEKPIYVTASIGIALAEEPKVEPKLLLKQADLALYGAKAAGRNQYKFHSAELDHDASVNLYLRQSLKELGRKDFRLVFQPQLNALTGEVVGLESLARWNHPKIQGVATDTIIKMIEDSGLMNLFSAWLLEDAFSAMEQWLRQDPNWSIPLSINLSAKQFRDSTLANIIIGRCHSHGIPADLIRFEVTESAFMDDPKTAASILGDLRAGGFKVALDDFGTGYSSLVYLRDIPLDTIKIDRSFVKDVLDDENDAKIVRAIIGLSETLGFDLIAEGVDNKDTMAWLCDHGCYIQQGYYFDKPLEKHEIDRMLHIGHL